LFCVFFAKRGLMDIRILIVDDSAIFRQGLRETLEAEVGWQVCGEAVDGLDAIEKNRLLTPHLIVMDLSMPRMTGLEAASEILREFPKVHILLLTLYLTSQLTEEARAVGIRATMSKTAMQQLKNGILTCLKEQASVGPAD
jgi:DNA-binding NarL/FixJ family response regulator